MKSLRPGAPETGQVWWNSLWIVAGTTARSRVFTHHSRQCGRRNGEPSPCHRSSCPPHLRDQRLHRRSCRRLRRHGEVGLGGSARKNSENGNPWCASCTRTCNHHARMHAMSRHSGAHCRNNRNLARKQMSQYRAVGEGVVPGLAPLSSKADARLRILLGGIFLGH